MAACRPSWRRPTTRRPVRSEQCRLCVPARPAERHAGRPGGRSKGIRCRATGGGRVRLRAHRLDRLARPRRLDRRRAVRPTWSPAFLPPQSSLARSGPPWCRPAQALTPPATPSRREGTVGRGRDGRGGRIGGPFRGLRWRADRGRSRGHAMGGWVGSNDRERRGAAWMTSACMAVPGHCPRLTGRSRSGLVISASAARR